MQLIKLLVFFSLIIATYNCGLKSDEVVFAQTENYDFSEIEPVLLGKTLNTVYSSKKIKNEHSKFSYTGVYVGSNNTSNEVNLTFNAHKNKECYQALLKLYNHNFNSNKTGNRFNSWSTDSLEILLFKQTDSTILVNIFYKTYK